VGLAPTGKRRLSRRTPISDIAAILTAAPTRLEFPEVYALIPVATVHGSAPILQCAITQGAIMSELDQY
jgi:hypothetical protein